MTLKQARKELLSHCKEIVDSCKREIDVIKRGYAYAQIESAMRNQPASSTAETTTEQPEGETVFKVVVGQDVFQGTLERAQAQLIQEWHKYLDAVFSEALRECLSKKELQHRCPKKIDVRLSNLEWGSKADIIKSVCDSLIEPFSFFKYQDKITTLTNIFACDVPDDLVYEVKKHVVIRNVFQHDRGVLRQKHLEKTGRNSTISILGDDGRPRELALNRKVELSFREVEHLYGKLKEYSLYFEKLQ